MSPLERLQRVKAHYPDICTFSKFDPTLFREVSRQVADLPEISIIQYQTELLNYVALSLVLKDKKFQSYVFMNAYELLDIYLGNKEEFSCISDITASLAIVYLGYSEFENKRQSDVIEQFIDIQRVNHRAFHLLFRGSSIESKYPTTASHVKSLGYPIITIKTSSKVLNQDADEI